MYLWQKKTGYFFQIRIPTNRVVELGKGHVRIWLGQMSKRDARRLALALAERANFGFETGMDRETLTRSLKALATEIEALRRQEFASGLSALAAGSRLNQAIEDGNDDPEFSASQRERVAAGRTEKQVAASLRRRLETVGQALEADAAALTAERAAYAHAIATVASLAPSALPTAPVAVQVQTAAAPALPAPVASPERLEDASDDERAIDAEMLLSVAGKIILDLRKETKAGQRGRDRYQDRLESTLAAFVDVIGDKPLSSYQPIHVQQFANAMAKCPKNRKKYREFDDLPIREIIKANEKRKPPVETLNESSIESLVSEITNLWAKVTAGVAGVRDLKTQKLTMPSVTREKNEREALLWESVDIWMKAAPLLDAPVEAYRKYLPLVGLLTGMRLGEIIWLQPKDFVEIDGHTVVDLRLPLIIERKQVPRRTKTITSPRVVALHPFLRESGFLDWAQEPKRAWVFGRFHRAQDPSDAAGKQMANWMRKLKIHREHEQVFHSLRHNAKHWLRGIGGDTGKFIADRQCGHAPGSVGDNYGFRVLQKDEIEKIEALPLPEDVDFSGFLKSR